MSGSGATSVNVTVVVNGHREGPLIAQTLLSARLAVQGAASASISAEILVVLDRPDELTREVVAEVIETGERVVEVDFGNLSSARNAGVKAALGRTIAFLDGDDLFGPTWLRKGFEFLEAHGYGDIVLHPQLSVIFGEETAIWEHIGMENPDFRLRHFAFENYFTSLAFTTADVLHRFPYRRISFGKGFGYEDWAWNCETLHYGVRHIVIPKTLHAVRRRRSSLLADSRANRLLRLPSALFSGREIQID